MSRLLVLCLAALLGSAVQGENLPPRVSQSLDALDYQIYQLRRESGSIPYHQRRRVIHRIERMVLDLEEVIDDLGQAPAPMPIRDWYQVNGADCYQFCASRGMTVGLSPEGAQCVSGENRAASALGKVSFVHGCWGDCSPQNVSQAASHGGYCYHPGQKRDNDRTDITVGCFCR